MDNKHAQSVPPTSTAFPDIDQVSAKYTEVMLHEEFLTSSFWQYPDAPEMYNTARQILEAARLNFVPRDYSSRYRDEPSTYVLESVGGQIMLTLSIVLKALDFRYWSNFTYTKEGYSLQEIISAITAYNQPKAKYGDTPENTDRDEPQEEEKINRYYDDYFNLLPNRSRTINYRVMRLLTEINGKSSPTGRLIYNASRIATIVAMLNCDRIGIDLLMKPDYPFSSTCEYNEMILCERHKDSYCYASEMWSIDYFNKSHLVAYDDYGYCTALLVMCTLLVTGGKWYDWREEYYS